MTKHPLIGGHVSAAGGLYTAIENAKRIGAQCFQIFGASPRRWFARSPSNEHVALFKKYLKGSGLGPVFLHAAYLPNLASDNDAWDKSVQSLSDHLRIADKIGAQGLIFHLGSFFGPIEEGVENTIRGVNIVLENVPGKTQLIMENSAGGGKKLGSNSQEVGMLFRGIKSPRVKVCIDTAHIFESGSVPKFTPENITKFCDEWDDAVGLKNIVALHASDSKTPAGSHLDRHENIGKGHIGLEGFKSLAAEKRLWNTCWLLEVPGYDDNGPDKKNMDILRSLFT